MSEDKIVVAAEAPILNVTNEEGRALKVWDAHRNVDNSNLRCFLRNPTKYKRKTVRTEALLEVLAVYASRNLTKDQHTLLDEINGLVNTSFLTLGYEAAELDNILNPKTDEIAAQKKAEAAEKREAKALEREQAKQAKLDEKAAKKLEREEKAAVKKAEKEQAKADREEKRAADAQFKKDKAALKKSDAAAKKKGEKVVAETATEDDLFS